MAGTPPITAKHLWEAWQRGRLLFVVFPVRVLTGPKKV